MNYLEAIRLALSSLRTNKMRSLLTLLGIIVGISSVIAILTLGRSLSSQTNQSLAESGINDFTVQVISREAQESDDPYAYLYSSTPVDKDSKITPEIINSIKDSSLGSQITGISIGDNSSHTVTLSNDDDKEEKTTARGVNLDYFTIKKVKLQTGRFFTEDEIDAAANVAVISPTTVNELFGGNAQAALGKDIELQNSSGEYGSFTIIGVYAPKKQSGVISFQDPPEFYFPYTVEPDISNSELKWDSISIRPLETTDPSTFKVELQKFFDEIYADNNEFTGKVLDFRQEAASFSKQLQTISLAISAIAGISLLVGGIGVMNIMLVTVTERTREIGVRKALGARRKDIRKQFVVESMIVCLIGGIIGVVLGSTLGILGAKLIGLAVFPPITGIVVALLFSLGIGLFFGYYPANKAAKMNPIDALRYE
ncbi:Macrolide export ATP-binding/permease protein macB [Corynebacterium kutscheri]|uniref:ABC-type antimicrobial peptide transport system, permease component n=1 Tax=Corynebacterium kutscheri TaxID=35755 RepID=A0A0F6QZZ9_9CORY|nr:ABC transporter permease [Corynebacterium kutscheri]AKE41432.1 ABC-type antimicrobial peptide transport system, permease component [Corynebacterium kutscheri]VEH08709.1 Macrolide export ATP-binding/permease protein macB [Corynebacterium kutscheri]VEH09756.1 Macrolide export ATP-binding/permease protein macB [Corynebacterium kutscheri]VEH79839.1 Macrolide export ATP-binding/permease protein macB [Corynebacterium kutscheri]